MDDQYTPLERITDLVPVLMAHGVTGAELRNAALEAQKQEVIYASVWAAGEYGYHYAQRPRARAAIRKMFPGTTLRGAWDPVEEELRRAHDDGAAEVFATRHLGGVAYASWWYDARDYPGKEEADAHARKQRAKADAMARRRRAGTHWGVREDGTRRDQRGNWYLVDMTMYRAYHGHRATLSNAQVWAETVGFVEGLDVPGAPLPEWWDAECEATYRRMRDEERGTRNPHRVTAEENSRYHRGR